jgi:hypothetical protein
MGRYEGPYHAMIVGIHGALHLAYITERYEGPYHAIIVRLHRGDYLAYIIGRYEGPSMLSGSTVTTAWRVLGLRIEDTASRYGG